MRENDGVFPYKREKLLSGVREGGFEGVYGRVICQVFLPCVVGTNHWRKNCSVNLLSKFCTTSDEVFCLFILENSYDMWVDGWKFKEQVKAGKEVSRRRKKEERVGPLYTVGSGSEARKYGGWSAAGIERWNVLFQQNCHLHSNLPAKYSALLLFKIKNKQHCLNTSTRVCA